VHVPVALVIVTVLPLSEQTPDTLMTTAPPGAVAATEKLEFNAAEAGAACVTVIV
jgi:hypothetical protein